MEMYNRNTNNDKNEVAEKTREFINEVLRLLMRNLALQRISWKLLKEMQEMGLQNVQKDKIKVDSWDFHHAVLRYRDKEDKEYEFQLGAYQTDFHTEGFQEFSMVYLGRGTAENYENIDVKGKLVLIDINQREEWWINFPVYQAHLKGAAALIAVQDQGYGEIMIRP